MSSNTRKAAVAGVLFVLALGLFLWNSGVLGSSPRPAPMSQQDIKKHNSGAEPGKNSATLGGLTPEPHM